MLSRKCIIFISLVVASVYTIELPPELKEYADALHDVCIERTGITEVHCVSEQPPVNSGGDSDHAEYDIISNPHDEKLQCYIKCLMMEANWMNKDGVIQYDWIEQNIHQDVKDVVVNALSQCKNVQEGANLCEKASHFNACMYEADKEFLPKRFGTYQDLLTIFFRTGSSYSTCIHEKDEQILANNLGPSSTLY